MVDSSVMFAHCPDFHRRRHMHDTVKRFHVGSVFLVGFRHPSRRLLGAGLVKCQFRNREHDHSPVSVGDVGVHVFIKPAHEGKGAFRVTDKAVHGFSPEAEKAVGVGPSQQVAALKPRYGGKGRCTGEVIEADVKDCVQTDTAPASIAAVAVQYETEIHARHPEALGSGQSLPAGIPLWCGQPALRFLDNPR